MRTDWKPERSPSGPITMVVSAADKAIYVYRNGNVIGRAPVEVKWPRFAGKSCLLAPRRHDRQESRWLPAGPRESGWPWRAVAAAFLPTRSRRACASTPSLRPRFTTRSHRGRQSSLPINRSCGAAAKPRFSRASGCYWAEVSSLQLQVAS